MPEGKAQHAGCRWYPIRFRQQYQTYVRVGGSWRYLDRAVDGMYRTRFSGHKAGYAAAGMSLRGQAARAASGLRRPFFSISQAAL